MKIIAFFGDEFLEQLRVRGDGARSRRREQRGQLVAQGQKA